MPKIGAERCKMSLGPLELAMIAAIALLFFGPAKLPQLGKSIGDAIRGFKTAMNDIQAPVSPDQNDKKPEKKEDQIVDSPGQDAEVKKTEKTTIS